MTGQAGRTRLCPFCGGDDFKIIGQAVFSVACKTCGATGPAQDAWAAYRTGMTDDEMNEMIHAAQRNAFEAWNRRPWQGNFFPDELEVTEN